MTWLQAGVLILVALPFVAIGLLVWFEPADGSEWRGW